MTYKIGQKVETSLGVGLIVASKLDGFGVNELYEIKFVSPNMSYQVSMIDKDLKPYKTPHEKLLEMGFEFEEVLDWGGNPFSHNWRKDDQRITIYLSENTITTYEVCKEAIAVLTQYLEWLEEQK